MKKRCEWPGDDLIMTEYHDNEWGVPIHDDRKWFEFILLDTFQAGLSWQIVLNKRENFRNSFDNFNYNKIALYGEEKVAELLSDAGIIRNRLKITATINNAIAFSKVQHLHGSFDAFIWKFTGDKPIVNQWKSLSEIPATSNESDQMSKALKKLGFKFVGSTTCYAFMQAGGMVNDHLVDCYRNSEISSDLTQPTIPG